MVRRILLAFLALLVLTTCFLFFISIVLHRQAEYIIRNVYDLSRQSQAPTVADLQQRFGNRLKRTGCRNVSDCEYEVTVSNRVLASLHLVPYGELTTYFATEDGVLLVSVTDFKINPHRQYSVMSHVQINYNCVACSLFTVHPWGDSAPLYSNGLVEFGYQTSDKNKRNALKLSTHCLTKLGGCDNVADLLPTVWKVRDNRVVCTLPNHTGFVSY